MIYDTFLDAEPRTPLAWLRPGLEEGKNWLFSLETNLEIETNQFHHER